MISLDALPDTEMNSKMESTKLLKRYFGHETFRVGQKQLIDALLTGRDVLGVMPTGAGKSVCYQLPAMMLDGLTLVISPLISLMKDQVTGLTAMGIPAAYINSMLSPREYEDTFDSAGRGQYKILYVAPERLLTNDFQRLCQRITIPLIAVDEAHCVSQWGQDFRPSYLDIAKFIRRMTKRPVVGAFTATATEVVKADIVKLLELRNPLNMTTGFDRPNLFFDVERPREKFARVSAYIREHEGQAGIIYCATRKTVEQVCEKLVQSGVSATRYHAGLSDEERRRNQEDFVYDRRRVMVATNAFGMGIDKSNISYVLHYNMPKNIESYYQEAGRAGRDGAAAQCVLFFSAGDVQTAKYLINASNENEALSEEERREVYLRDMERLRRMTGYCKTSGCFRHYLLQYFGEHAPDKCDNCGNCVGERSQADITVPAQKILSAVVRVERRFPGSLGITLIVRMLHGSGEQRIRQLGLDAFPTYGIMRDTDRMKIREYIDALTEQGYLTQTEGSFPVLRVTDRAWDVLRGKTRVTAAVRPEKRAEPIHKRKKGEYSLDKDDGLFEALRALRTELAKAEGVPAYVVFSNAALVDMAVKRPHDMREFLNISGVGEYKANRYGRAFLDAIGKWEENK